MTFPRFLPLLFAFFSLLPSSSFASLQPPSFELKGKRTILRFPLGRRANLVTYRLHSPRRFVVEQPLPSTFSTSLTQPKKKSNAVLHWQVSFVIERRERFRQDVFFLSPKARVRIRRRSGVLLLVIDDPTRPVVPQTPPVSLAELRRISQQQWSSLRQTKSLITSRELVAFMKLSPVRDVTLEPPPALQTRSIDDGSVQSVTNDPATRIELSSEAVKQAVQPLFDREQERLETQIQQVLARKKQRELLQKQAKQQQLARKQQALQQQQQDWLQAEQELWNSSRNDQKYTLQIATNELRQQQEPGLQTTTVPEILLSDSMFPASSTPAQPQQTAGLFWEQHLRSWFAKRLQRSQQHQQQQQKQVQQRLADSEKQQWQSLRSHWQLPAWKPGSDNHGSAEVAALRLSALDSLPQFSTRTQSLLRAKQWAREDGQQVQKRLAFQELKQQQRMQAARQAALEKKRAQLAAKLAAQNAAEEKRQAQKAAKQVALEKQKAQKAAKLAARLALLEKRKQVRKARQAHLQEVVLLAQQQWLTQSNSFNAPVYRPSDKQSPVLAGVSLERSSPSTDSAGHRELFSALQREEQQEQKQSSQWQQWFLQRLEAHINKHQKQLATHQTPTRQRVQPPVRPIQPPRTPTGSDISDVSNQEATLWQQLSTQNSLVEKVVPARGDSTQVPAFWFATSSLYIRSRQRLPLFSIRIWRRLRREQQRDWNTGRRWQGKDFRQFRNNRRQRQQLTAQQRFFQQQWNLKKQRSLQRLSSIRARWKKQPPPTLLDVFRRLVPLAKERKKTRSPVPVAKWIPGLRYYLRSLAFARKENREEVRIGIRSEWMPLGQPLRLNNRVVEIEFQSMGMARKHRISSLEPSFSNSLLERVWIQPRTRERKVSVYLFFRRKTSYQLTRLRGTLVISFSRASE